MEVGHLEQLVGAKNVPVWAADGHCPSKTQTTIFNLGRLWFWQIHTSQERQVSRLSKQILKEQVHVKSNYTGQVRVRRNRMLKQALDKTVIVDSQSANPKPLRGPKGISSVLGRWNPQSQNKLAIQRPTLTHTPDDISVATSSSSNGLRKKKKEWPMIYTNAVCTGISRLGNYWGAPVLYLGKKSHWGGQVQMWGSPGEKVLTMGITLLIS